MLVTVKPHTVYLGWKVMWPPSESTWQFLNNRSLLSSTLRYLPMRSENCIIQTYKWMFACFTRNHPKQRRQCLYLVSGEEAVVCRDTRSLFSREGTLTAAHAPAAATARAFPGLSSHVTCLCLECQCEFWFRFGGFLHMFERTKMWETPWILTVVPESRQVDKFMLTVY